MTASIDDNFAIFAFMFSCSVFVWFDKLDCLVKLAPHIEQINGLSKVCSLKCKRKDAFLKLFGQRGQAYFKIEFLPFAANGSV